MTEPISEDPTTARPNEVWADRDGCLLACGALPGVWFAFGRTEPLWLHELHGNDRPMLRLITADGRYVGPADTRTNPL